MGAEEASPPTLFSHRTENLCAPEIHAGAHNFDQRICNVAEPRLKSV
jgi:hypothetical protein